MLSAPMILQARDLLTACPLVDGHNDLPWAVRQREEADLSRFALWQPALQTDLVRLRAGHVAAQFWSVYVPVEYRGADAVLATLEQIDLVYRMVDRYRDHLRLVRCVAEVEEAFRSGYIASLLGAEGGHCIDGSLAVLRIFHRLGVRYLTLTHNESTPWAGSAADEPMRGLNDLGRSVVAELNRLGMLVDLSHTSVSTTRDALATSNAPAVFTHSACRALVDHPRNVGDDVLVSLAEGGGVCMIAFVPAFVSADCAEWEREPAGRSTRHRPDARAWAAGGKPTAHAGGRPTATLAQVADHIDHAREVAGVDHVGIGGDYDGTAVQPLGLEDVSCYPALFAELLSRGWSKPDLAKLAGGNVLRVLADAEAVARSSAAATDGP